MKSQIGIKTCTFTVIIFTLKQHLSLLQSQKLIFNYIQQCPWLIDFQIFSPLKPVIPKFPPKSITQIPTNALNFPHWAAHSSKIPPNFCVARLGFTDLEDTLTVDVQRAEGRRLSAPFTIAMSRLDRVENATIRVELSNGCVSWGEAPILSFVTAQDQPATMKKATEVCGMLWRSLAMTLGSEFASAGFWD